MKLRNKLACYLGLVALSSFCATPNHAELVSFQTYSGTVGVSTDGASDPGGVISASAPVGSTVVAAYLYTATYTFGGAPDLSQVQLGGTTVSYDATFPNATACCSLSSSRADVTSIVAAVINGGAGGVYNFTYSEGSGSGNIDGSALVVVYSNAALPTTTVGILNGFASVTGDDATISFANALHPGDPGFKADMFLGIGFSCCDQESVVNVNGNLMTSVAGNFDDGNAQANGQLITVGGFNDPYTVTSPGTPATDYDADHEKYNLIPFIADGSTSILVHTANASEDDNIFLAVFQVSGEGTVTAGPVPVPAAAWLFGSVLGLAGYARRRHKNKKAAAAIAA